MKDSKAGGLPPASGRGGRRIFTAYYPTKTMPVSVTGAHCDLLCAHCGGHYLKNMVAIDDLHEKVRLSRPESLLLSGGCTKEGIVPLKRQCAVLKKQGFKLNVHPGIVKREDACFIADCADVISFDFVLDDEAIQKAFYGMWKKEEYIDTLRALRSGNAKVVPHILLGLNEGKVKEEKKAVDFLLEEGVDKIVFIVFIPTKGTAWGHLPPPPAKDVLDVISHAREKGPYTDLVLGCMRPWGLYRKELDSGVAHLVDGMVNPHPSVLSALEEADATINREDRCCAF